MNINEMPGGQRMYVLVDRSGSMESLRAVVVNEVNRLIETLQAERPVTRLSIVGFDSHRGVEWLIDDVSVSTVGPWTIEDFQTGGGTPLYDALDDVLDHATRRQAGERYPSRVLIAVLTDGDENASVRTTSLALAGRVRRRKSAGWEMLYLGAGDPLRDAGRIGFDAVDVQPWNLGEAGIRDAFATLTFMATQLPPRPRPRPRHHR